VYFVLFVVNSLVTLFATRRTLFPQRSLGKSVYCYPKIKTNMFVITRSVGKFSGDRRLSDSDMPPAKAQRRQVRREKTNILTKDFHVFSPTFAALASLREIFQIRIFYSVISVLLSMIISAPCANFLCSRSEGRPAGRPYVPFVAFAFFAANLLRLRLCRAMLFVVKFLLCTI
jgi:hypothetical protein